MLHRAPTPLPSDENPKPGGKPQTQSTDKLWKSLYYLYILVSFGMGAILLFLPWLETWENNYLLYLYPQFRPLLANAFFKGFVLGLGVANILIGIQEVAQLRHDRKAKHLSR